MKDQAHEITDKKLSVIEKQLSKIYNRAYNEVGKEWKEYLKRSTEKIEHLQEEYKKAKQSNDILKINSIDKQLKRAKQAYTLRNKRFKILSEQLAEEIKHINETATAYINNKLPDIYSLNYNYLSNTVDEINGYSFTLTDSETVKNLAIENKTLLPYKYIDGKKDIRWNTQKINAEILQGILQGESMDKIAKRLKKVLGMNKISAIRNARTTVTSAENKGRFDSYIQAEKDGIILKKKWISTNDNRTRHWHSELNGIEIDIYKPFVNSLGKIMYPGDINADPANVYN